MTKRYHLRICTTMQLPAEPHTLSEHSVDAGSEAEATERAWDECERLYPGAEAEGIYRAVILQVIE